MKKEKNSLEDVHQIIMDVRGSGDAKKKARTKKRGKLVETDIDLFATDEDDNNEGLRDQIDE